MSSVRAKRARLKLPSQVKITVGIIDGDRSHGDSEETVGSIAEQHEFGLGVPERSWLRAWFDSQSAGVKEQASAYFRQAALGEAGFEQAAKALAILAESSIKRRISEGKVTPPITNPRTIASKQERGFQPPYVPLVETGVLLSAITAVSEVTP